VAVGVTVLEFSSSLSIGVIVLGTLVGCNWLITAGLSSPSIDGV